MSFAVAGLAGFFDYGAMFLKCFFSRAGNECSSVIFRMRPSEKCLIYRPFYYRSGGLLGASWR